MQEGASDVNPNDFNAAEQPAPIGENADQPDVTMPLGTGEFTDQVGADPLAGATTRRSFNGGPLLVIAVIVIAAGGLFSMRKLAQVTAAPGIDAGAETTIEDFLKKVDDPDDPLGDKSGSGDRIIAVLRETYSEQQVPLEDVQRDPFILDEAGGPALVYDPTADDLTRREQQFRQERDARRVEFEQAGATMRVRSVLAGSNPLANINGDVVRIGDIVRAGSDQIEFRVSAISTATVDLVAEDPRYDLLVTVTLNVQDGR
jgi:hypothetical protein